MLKCFKLVCRGTEFLVPKPTLIQLQLFDEHGELFNSPAYNVRTDVDVDTFSLFVQAIEGKRVEVVKDNVAWLSRLCEEFGFTGLDQQLKEFKSANQSLMREEEMVTDLNELKERACEQQLQIEGLRSENRFQAAEIQTLKSELGKLRASNDDLRKKMDEMMRLIKSGDVGSSGDGDEETQLVQVRSRIGKLQQEEQRLEQMTALTMHARSHNSSHQKTLLLSTLFEPGKPLNGIIAQLTKKFGRYVHNKGVIDVFCVPDEFAKYAKYVAELDNNSNYMSEGGSDRYIGYDFLKRTVKPTHYTIMSYGGAVGGSHMRSWVVEISMDGKTWEEIDRRSNNNDLNGPSRVATFSVSRTDEGRYIRLRQIGPNHLGSNSMFLTVFELFGFVFE